MLVSPMATGHPLPTLLSRSDQKKPFDASAIPDTDAVVKRRLLRKGVVPTPKILHTLRKKEAQKSLRRSKKQTLTQESPPLSDSQRQTLEEEALFRAAIKEYQALRAELRRRGERAASLAGKPWERCDAVDLSGLRSSSERDGAEGRLKGEHLEELREMLAERNGERFRWLLDDDVEEVGGRVEERGRKMPPLEQTIGEEEKIQSLVERLSSTNLSMQDWKFSRLMKQSGLIFTEMHLLKIIGRLGNLGGWKHALSVVEWVFNEKDYRYRKSRFVYTKLLAVLGKARRPSEALRIFNMMREDCQIYPDMAAYHTIAVTLGQAGLLHELINVIECMRQKPSKRIRNMKRRIWDPCLEPDVIVYNAVLNACIPSHHWKGVFWVLEQMRHNGLKPTGATYGLAMEVMLRARKYDLVYSYFEKMQKGGLPPKALTYKVLVRAFWEEGKVDKAVEVVRDMEQRGVVGAACVYYELACCLCNSGRWEDAMAEIHKLKNLPRTKPLEVTFTGLILSSLDGGYISDCISIFEHMKDYCTPNIGTINAMLKVYGGSDMFTKAKELFEATKVIISGSGSYIDDDSSLKPDAYSYSSMLEASAAAHQWEYFEYVYKEMALCGYQLDQSKYAWLLVEASKAGKWELLDHAFDSILEAGEIPNVSLFTEMICQTITQQNFGRTVTLINGMAHASLKVSEIQWTNLFLKNIDRFNKDKLQELLKHLGRCNLVTEDPVPNFLKSLQTICAMRLSPNPSVCTNNGDVSDDNVTYNENQKGLEIYEKIQDHLPAPSDDDDNEDNDNGDDGSTLPSTEDRIFNMSCVDTMKRGSCPGVSLQDYDHNVSSSSADGCEGKEVDSILGGNSEATITDTMLDLLTSRIGRPFSGSPTASEILETWRQDRMKG